MTSVRQRCRRRRYKGYEAREAEDSAEGLGSGDRRGRDDRDTTIGGGNIEVTANTPTWTELAREAAHVSTSYTYVVHNK